MKFPAILFSAALVAVTATSALAGDTRASNEASVYIVNLKDGDTVTSPVKVLFGLKGMGVAPAGLKDVPNSGHHHLLIDAKITGAALNNPIPSDANHRHFGKGQTETTIELSPGKHTLQLLLGDWKHTPHRNPVMSKPITITVK